MAQKENNSKKRVLQDMPHSLEAEQALLGCILLDNRIQVEVASLLKEEDFYAETHKIIFNAMNEIIFNNKPVDIVVLSDYLENKGELESAGGIEYIATLADYMPSTANYKSYFDIVKADSMRRKLILGASEIIENSKQTQNQTDALSFAEKVVYDISDTVDTGDMKKISSVIPDVMLKLDEIAKDKSSTKGIRTGFRGIDSLLNGLHKSDLIILAARPAVGKTSFSMNIVENVALQGYTCAVFSLEMSKEQLVQRMICSVAGVSMSNANKGIMNRTEWLKIAKAREMLAGAKIYIDDSAMTNPQQIMSKCRRLKAKEGLDLVMIDYIQLMQTAGNRKNDNRQQEITEISRYLKILAKELNVPVIALSQLSRAIEQRKGRPQLSDLRESGAIEQDADIVMFIHRPDKNATEKELAEGTVQKNVAEIIVEKHRNGGTGIVKLYFKGECTKFVDLAEDGEPEGEEPTRSDDRSYGEDLSKLEKADLPFDVGGEESAKTTTDGDSGDLPY